MVDVNFILCLVLTNIPPGSTESEHFFDSITIMIEKKQLIEFKQKRSIEVYLCTLRTPRNIYTTFTQKNYILKLQNIFEDITIKFNKYLKSFIES